MNLYQKIVEVRKIAEGFNKDKKSYSYEYVSGNQILSKIKDKMNELNLLLIPSTKIGEHHTHAYKTAKGKDVLDFVVKGEMSYTWINGDEPAERETISWAYYGQQDDISKAYGSALTYSERYFLLKCLGLPTDEDDPDSKPEKTYQKPNQQSQSKQTNGSVSQAELNKIDEDLAEIEAESNRVYGNKGGSSGITITPVIKGRYQAVHGSLNGIENYVAKFKNENELNAELTKQLQAKAQKGA